MNLFRQWINDETSEHDGSSLRNLEIEICYFSEDDKKQMDNQISKEKAAGLYPSEDEF